MPIRRAQTTLIRYWDRSIPVDPAKIARAAGASLFADFSMPTQGLNGSFIIDDGVPAISFSPDDPWVRQRFSIAHSLGHMVLGHGRSLSDDQSNYSASVDHYKEREANTFAMELLMPKEVIDWMVVKRGNRDVGEMSRALSVSERAMQARLEGLGYLSKRSFF